MTRPVDAIVYGILGRGCDFAGAMATAAVALTLAACSTLSGPASETEAAIHAPSQSNLTSLTEVIEKHPDDPQAYNMRGAVYGEAGRNDQGWPTSTKRSASTPITCR